MYEKMALSFFNSGQFLYQGIPTHQFPPLYPITLSIGFFFHDMDRVYFCFKVINAILSSLIIILIYFLAREFVDDGEALIIALFTALLPIAVYSSVLMSENLFYPLFIFSIFYVFKSCSENKKNTDILCGISIGLCYLTKITGFLMFIPLFAGLAVISVIQVLEKNRVSIGRGSGKSVLLMSSFFHEFCGLLIKKWIVLVVAILTILPWIIRNVQLFGFSLFGILGNYSNEVATEAGPAMSLPVFIWYMVNHISYLVIGSAVIFFAGAVFLLLILLNNFQNDENRKLLLITIIVWSVTLSFVFLSSYHVYLTSMTIDGYHRIQGRYIAQVLPLFYILGYIGLKRLNAGMSLTSHLHYNRIFIFSLVLCSILLFFSPLEFLNDQAITSAPDILFLMILEIPKNLLMLSLVLVPVILILLYRFGKFKSHNFFPLVIIFLLCSCAIAYNYNIGMSHWVDGEKEIARFVYSEYDGNSTIFLDQRDNVSSVLQWTLEFWTDAKIIRGNPTTDPAAVDSQFIISSHTINSTKVFSNKKWAIYLPITKGSPDIML
jgi:hypothetical protein